ncbi:hypothetical protein C8R45DRAFT_1007920 [Mycena sanguinolenta]|nr:hypothetical protein C8R45DRAFT_1007920 [Mycena sanguinolenta]
MSAVRAHGTGTMTNPWRSSSLKTPKRVKDDASPSALCSSPPEAPLPHQVPSVITGLVFYSLLPLPQHLRRILLSSLDIPSRYPEALRPQIQHARGAQGFQYPLSVLGLHSSCREACTQLSPLLHDRRGRGWITVMMSRTHGHSSPAKTLEGTHK